MQVPRHKIAFAAISFVVGLVLMYFVGSYLQLRFGMLGLALTEFFILGFALLSTWASGLRFKQVFRVRRGRAREWVASLFVYLGAFFGALCVSYVLTLVSPALVERGAQLNGFIMSGGMAVAFVAVSLLPGICEEAWHRGYLLSSLGAIKGVVARVVIMGLVFGVFHLDSARFFQTMVLGMALSYMRIKTDNFVVPVVFHTLNNLISVLAAFAFAGLGSQLGGGDAGQAAQAAQAALEGSSAALTLAVYLPLICFTLAMSLGFLALGRYYFKRVGAPQSPTT